MNVAIAPITAVGAVLVGTFGVVAAIVHEPEPSYPDRWDERVLELVDFVEDERGHDFEHPVVIEFLSDEEYTERTRSEATALTDEELASAEQVEGLLRALGLVVGDIDLVESSNDLSDTGTLAYYDSEEEQVTVRGTEVTPGLAVTLVHELTHVLQDQLFDLDRLGDDDATSGELAAFRSLVEGDAIRIEGRYRDTLSDDELAAIDQADAEGAAAVEEEAIPEALQAIFGLPYALGEGFLGVLEAQGDDANDEAFRAPPSTEEHLLDPLRYLADDDAFGVAEPEVDERAEILETGDFGAASLYLVLASRIDPRQALGAALGWGGDSYVNYVLDGISCVDLRVTGDEPSDVEELRAALDAWTAGGPTGSATAASDGDVVSLHACDPGVEATAGPASAIDALSLAATRTVILGGILASGADEDFARCYADGVVAGFGIEELTSPVEPADFESRLGSIAVGCQ